MKSEARNRLRNTVGRVRNLIEEDFRSQLLRLGIKKSELIPVNQLDHLDASMKEKRQRIEEALRKEKIGDLSQIEAFERYLRHAGFSFVNRVAALKAMEVRNLLSRETVTRRETYAGYSAREYEISEREDINHPNKIPEIAFREACDEISEEVSILFDLTDEYSILFPSIRVLDQIYEHLGNDIPDEDWQSDDVIGWIYQYYNSEARKKFRKKKARPKADDIPVVNQFYTPEWIVKSLVDNSLGRLWLESNEFRGERSDNHVGSFCDYFIPTEPAFSRKPVNPESIKILDPACGSGHFLVYAFDVMFGIYEQFDSSLSAEEICDKILRHNLYGIDIDLRAVQLAALSLYLKAKKLSSSFEISVMHLVCADARITDGEMERQFLKLLEPSLDLQKAFAQLFRELDYTYHLGSLFKIKGRFNQLLETPSFQASLEAFLGKDNKEESIQFDKSTSTMENMKQILGILEKRALESHDMGSLLFTSEAEKSLGLLSLLAQEYDVVVMNPPYGDQPAETKEYLKEHYPHSHRDYYTAFIDQAVDLCKPSGYIGMLTGQSFMYLKWFERVRTEILAKEANPLIVFDLGSDVLDEAIGLWAAMILRIKSNCCSLNEKSEILFFSLTKYLDEHQRIAVLDNALEDFKKNKTNKDLYISSIRDLKKLPGMPFSYWIPKSVSELFTKYPPLDRDNSKRDNPMKIASLKQGLATADVRRFVRYWWEVAPETIGKSRKDTRLGKKWIPFPKGGGSYYSEIPLVVNWGDDGKDLRHFAESTGRPRIQNESRYFESGLCWSRTVSSILMDFRKMESGCIFSVAALALFPEITNIEALMGVLNSSLLALLFSALNPAMHDRHLGYVAEMPISMELLENDELTDIVAEMYETKLVWQTGNETSIVFDAPWILQVSGIELSDSKPKHPFTQNRWDAKFKAIRDKIISLSKTKPKKSVGSSFLSQIAVEAREYESEIRRRIFYLQSKIDEIVYDGYNIPSNDRRYVEIELKTLRGFPKALKKDYEEATQTEISIREHLERLISYYATTIIKEEEDGIVLLSTLEEKIQKRILEDFGNCQLDEMNSDLAFYLKKPVKEWLQADYFSFHTSLYERRPIVWHMTSTKFSLRKNNKDSFHCFLYFHKLDRDTIHKIRSKYLKAELDAKKWTVDSLRRRLNNEEISDLDSEEELKMSQEELEELEKFDSALKSLVSSHIGTMDDDSSDDWVKRKVMEIAENGFSPIIDYGVLVNIMPLKKAGVMHNDARRIK